MTTSKKRISLYLDEELKARLELLAKTRRRSLSNLIETCMEEVVNESESKGEGR